MPAVLAGRKTVSQGKVGLDFHSAHPRGINIMNRKDAKKELGWRRELG